MLPSGNNSSSNCNCSFCRQEGGSSTSSSSSKTPNYQSPYQYVTNAALLRLGHDSNLLVKRIEPIREYFSQSYMAKKGRSYLQACQAAEGALSGEFAAPNSKIRHYTAYSIKPYEFAEYDKPEYHDKRAMLLQASGNEGKKAWLEHKPLSAIDTYTMTAAQIPTNREAREYFAGKDHAVVLTRRSTEKWKDWPYFLHYSPNSVVPGPYSILPLELKKKRRWSTKRGSKEEKNMQPMQQVPGIPPIHEMFQASKEDNLLHPTDPYAGPYEQSVIHKPVDCGKWDCSICYSLTKFDEPIRYSLFLGG